MGEDAYDAQALAQLVWAICPTAVVAPLRQPVRLRRGEQPEHVDVVLKKVLPVLRAELARGPTACAFVHADADAAEPHDAVIAERIEQALQALAVPVHAVVPAWELEAWWFLWPDACLSVVGAWRRPDRYVGRRVGTVRDAKEALRRALRPTSVARTRRPRDYRESDAPAIARTVRESGVVNQPAGESRAFERFRSDVTSCCTS